MNDITHQIRESNTSIFCMRIENFIEAGNQAIPADLSQLKYGCSVTDACVNWETKEGMLREAAQLLLEPLKQRGL